MEDRGFCAQSSFLGLPSPVNGVNFPHTAQTIREGPRQYPHFEIIFDGNGCV